MRDRNSFDYTRTADNRDFSDLTRCVPHADESIRPVHYGESDVGAMQFTGAPTTPKQSAGNPQDMRAPEQQTFLPNNYGASAPTAFASDNFGGNGGNGFGNNGNNGNSFGGGANGYSANSNVNARISPDRPLQTTERPLVFKNKRVEGQFIYEYRDRLEIYKYTGVGMIYVETLFKNGY